MATKIPCLFVDDESGEPWQLIAKLDEKILCKANSMAYVEVILDGLRDAKSGRTFCLHFKRLDMTQSEIDVLPDL